MKIKTFKLAGLILLIVIISSSCNKENTLNENELDKIFENATELKNSAVFHAEITKGEKDTYLIHPHSNINISIDCDNNIDFHIIACNENHENIWEHSSAKCNENHGHNNHSDNNGNNSHHDGNHENEINPHHLVHSIHTTDHHGTCYLIIESTNNIEGDYTIKID
jgi:hypothetical protein